MNEPTLDAVMQRLDRLERENRWWKMVGGGAIAVLTLIVLLGAARREKPKVADEIRARRFIVEDETGRTRASLDVAKSVSRLHLYDNAGKPRLVLGTFPTGSMVGLMNHDGVLRTALSADSGGDTRLELFDNDGAAVATLYASPDRASGLGFADKSSRVPLLIVLKPDGQPSLNFYTDKVTTLQLTRTGLLMTGKNGISRALLSIGDDGLPLLGLTDRNGNLIWKAP